MRLKPPEPEPIPVAWGISEILAIWLSLALVVLLGLIYGVAAWMDWWMDWLP
jgi:hypothetical protein